jgi:hypothetical protein
MIFVSYHTIIKHAYIITYNYILVFAIVVENDAGFDAPLAFGKKNLKFGLNL